MQDRLFVSLVPVMSRKRNIDLTNSLASFYGRRLKRHAWQFLCRTLTYCPKPKIHRACEFGEHVEVVGEFEAKTVGKEDKRVEVAFSKVSKTVEEMH